VRLAERPAGPRPGGPVQPWSGLRDHTVARAPSALAAWSPHATRAWDGAVARSSTARWRLAGGKVLPVRSWGPPGGHRAKRAETGLTEGGDRLQGGVEAPCGDVRQGLA
jgi:hypothetical protein